MVRPEDQRHPDDRRGGEPRNERPPVAALGFRARNERRGVLKDALYAPLGNAPTDGDPDQYGRPEQPQEKYGTQYERRCGSPVHTHSIAPDNH